MLMKRKLKTTLAVGVTSLTDSRAVISLHKFDYIENVLTSKVKPSVEQVGEGGRLSERNACFIRSSTLKPTKPCLLLEVNHQN